MKTFAGRKLGRTSSHRRSLLRNLAASLLQHEKIQTTVPKAKEAVRLAERLITVAKRGGLNAQRRVAEDLPNDKIRKKLFEVIAPRYKDRQGGYTRIIRVGTRLSDNADIGIAKLV